MAPRRGTVLAAVIAAICAAPAFAADFEPPIAPAALGQMQCFAPDTAHKTCRSLSAYRISVMGGFNNVALVLISSQPAIIMQTTSPVEVRNGQVCGPVRDDDIDDARFLVDDEPATEPQAAKLREGLKAAMKDLIGHELCTTYVAEGDVFRATATLDGVPQPAMDQAVIWVAPQDGYRVAP